MNKPRIRPWHKLAGVQYYRCHSHRTTSFGPGMEIAYWRWVRDEQQLQGAPRGGEDNDDYLEEDLTYSPKPDGKLGGWGLVTLAGIITVVVIIAWVGYHVFD